MFMFLKYFIFSLPFLFLTISCDDNPTIPDREIPPVEEIIPDEDKEWQLIWSDEFDSETLDMSKWSYQLGTGSDEGLTDWGNEELQYYTDHPENVYIEDDMLHIVALRESLGGKQYTSGRIRTINKGDWMYGRIEIRAKSPIGQGIWPAIWMLPTGEGKIWPRDGEIDIMELVGHKPQTVHGTVHFGDVWPDHDYDGSSYTLSNGTFADDFHIFSIEWKLDEIKFFVNDNHFYTATPATTSKYGYNYPFNNTFHLLLNVAVGGRWPGSPDATTQFPQKMVIDYVRVYQFK